MINFRSISLASGPVLSQLRAACLRGVHGPMALAWIALLAFVGTLTAGIPFGPVLVLAVIVAPTRWKAMVLVGSLAAATGALTLLAAVNWLGESFLFAHVAEWAGSDAWLRTQAWVADYGLVALFFVSATPLPQTPAILLCSIADYSSLSMFLTLFAGKLLKYGVYGASAAYAPDQVIRLFTRTRRLFGLSPGTRPSTGTSAGTGTGSVPAATAKVVTDTAK